MVVSRRTSSWRSFRKVASTSWSEVFSVKVLLSAMLFCWRCWRVFASCGGLHLNSLLHNTPVLEWIRVKHVSLFNQWSASCILKWNQGDLPSLYACEIAWHLVLWCSVTWWNSLYGFHRHTGAQYPFEGKFKNDAPETDTNILLEKAMLPWCLIRLERWTLMITFKRLNGCKSYIAIFSHQYGLLGQPGTYQSLSTYIHANWAKGFWFEHDRLREGAGAR